MDETGFQMGVILTAKVICGADIRDSHTKAVQPRNREWTTAIIAVNISGWALPPYIILAAENDQSQWYNNIPSNYQLSVSKNGWTNNRLGLDLSQAMAWVLVIGNALNQKLKQSYIYLNHGSEKSKC